MTPGPDDRPLLFLDVDGPLIPFRGRATGQALAGPGAGNPLLDRLDPADGRRLSGLGCQLVWATTWMADANEVIAPRLGLPELPVVEFPDDDPPGFGLHWKTRFLARWAGGRPFIWLDDEISPADRLWIRANYQGRALVHRVDPFAGLTEADFALIRRWLVS
ncbi:HAD domain-containing protein [Actinoplanes sp. NPDC026623]|uniref:HAD domain-containing protein n=1 Tax=Actinoplanes sp. NPDC026623 TaxID=3155610 RepID=UPI0033FBAFF7